MITARDLFKVYVMGKVEVNALNGVSVDVKKGEFVGITGSSGSGKSTLLHLVGLLDTPSSGTLMIDGNDVLKLNDSEKTQFRLNRFGFVFQDYALVAELTAIENVYLPSMARGQGREEYLSSSYDILEKVGLLDRADHLPKELSGGEQQRVAIARGLVNRPDIMFADEPCANLDSKNSKITLELFKQINKELGQTILMVSHEEWHNQYFDRVITLQDGKIIDAEG